MPRGATGTEDRKHPVCSYEAAKESNLPSAGLRRPAGFEDRMGHQAPAAPRAKVATRAGDLRALREASRRGAWPAPFRDHEMLFDIHSRMSRGICGASRTWGMRARSLRIALKTSRTVTP